jgi:hypothetical protein
MITAALSVHPGMPRTMRKTFWLLFAMTAVLALVARGSWAAPWDSYETNADGRLVDVRVLVNGRVAPLYIAPGHDDRSYFQAFQGRNYSLLLHNNSGRRVGVLIAVDGLNVINGERSHLSRNEAMYVLDPYEETTINGWRTSLDEVRRFVFVDEDRSYAERTGQANGDMGWIRVATFEEVRPYAWGNIKGLYRGGADDRGGVPAPSAPELEGRAGDQKAQRGAQPNSQGLARDEARGDESFPGTGWGESREDHVNRVQFLAAATPTDQLVLRYEYASGLRALGIEPRTRRVWDREQGELGFARPPQR